MERTDSVDERLANVLAQWAKDEIGRGYRVAKGSTSYVQTIVADGNVTVTPHTSLAIGGLSAEGAARGLVGAVVQKMIEAGTTPDTHILVWRSEPEIRQTGEYVRIYEARARFCFAEAAPGSTSIGLL